MNAPLPDPLSISALRQRVTWSEGMFLRPHHFQQQERYFEEYVQARCLPLRGFHWGWHRLVLDRAALATGRIALQEGSGILPDGTPFSFALREAPESFMVPADLHDETICLVLPEWRAGPAFSDADPQSTQWSRFAVRDIEIEDANVEAFGPALLQVAHLDLRLMRASEVRGGAVAIGMVQVRERRNDGHVVLDDGYLPPLLSGTHHPQLRAYLEELHGLLQQRGEVMGERLSQGGRGGVAEVADFLMLELINRYTAVTWCALQAACLHPEQLFADWLKLACDLATHTSETRRPRILPPYRHDALRESFEPLMVELRRSLSTVLEQHAIAIALQERGNGVSVAQIPSLDLLQQAAFVLAVKADMPADTLRAHFPAQLKMGAVERIRDLVLLQLPGIGIRQLSVAPRQLPYHAGYAYYELETGSEFWKQLEKSGGLALHVAGEFPGLDLEFWAIRQ